ncbi:Thiol-specific monooxygenase [Colletotrichum orbiculare MAFF 240422]|uniref:Thiol-specific monooxygenase n=1 Tax=Colletotrichum orbiculare (strain 104-T / ATCC 96160 / CBS 514.97 / LARS 414 / MAFF 240422) TaxID=1213857 RepID=N4VTI5_COLOR|nr:Thiol-specific monooxygenase [Colletotrichum orbiculare MAFF 240422]
MPSKIRRVAVIGAGPSGAIATDALVKEQAFDTVRVFDRRAEPGGTWIYTPQLPTAIPSLRKLLDGEADAPVPIPAQLPAQTNKSEAVNSHQIRFSDTAQHEHLHTNITPEIMSFTTEPFPDTLTDRIREKYGDDSPFRGRGHIREWVENIFVRNGHEKLLDLSTTVELAEKKGSEWILTLRKELPGKDQWWQETFDAVVVATGHYNIPWIPDIPGIREYDERFPGRVVHSKHFRGADRFKGKKVIVVGGPVSSHELLHEVLPVAQHPVYASLRGEPIPLFGWEPFTHPHVSIQKQIVHLCHKTGTVTFEDSTKVKDVDHIIFGTGYTFSFPFLPKVQERVLQANSRLPGVYYHAWDIEDPTLAFLGMCGGGFTFRLFEWQAVAVARLLAGRGNPLPSKEDQREWERKRVAEFGGGRDYYTIAPHWKDVFEYLRSVAGDPAPGTTGRVLPVFDDNWLEIWATMGSVKTRSWEVSRQKAEAEAVAVKEDEGIRAKL